MGFLVSESILWETYICRALGFDMDNWEWQLLPEDEELFWRALPAPAPTGSGAWRTDDPKCLWAATEVRALQ